ncbi:MAG: hypothetical protein HDR36_01850 [Treponema sp.]|nr:hypothetical protein [Treponema sp.]
MSMLLDDPNGVADVRGRDFWVATLKNDKILLDGINRAIVAFTSSTGADGIAEYTIDTGQDRQTVKRTDLSSLYLRRDALVDEIARLERELYGGSRWTQVVPGY